MLILSNGAVRVGADLGQLMRVHLDLGQLVRVHLVLVAGGRLFRCSFWEQAV